MLKIILLRPGSTEFDLQGRILGTLDVPLCQAGAVEVSTAIEALRGEGITMIYCSPSRSSLDTAEALAAALGIKCKTLKALQNVDYGLWQGLEIDEVRRKQPRVFKQWQEHPETICPPEGEMLVAARQRVDVILAKALKKHREGTIALVAPEPLAGIIRAHLQKAAEMEVWNLEPGCGRWEVIPLVPDAAEHAAQALGAPTQRR